MGGLENIFLVNGFTRHFEDGEESVSIDDIDGLRSAIALYIVTSRKVLTPGEVRFLRDQLEFTQRELGELLGVTDQSIARWEKGQTELPGPADRALRYLVITSVVPASDAEHRLPVYMEKLHRNVVERDEGIYVAGWFTHGENFWEGRSGGVPADGPHGPSIASGKKRTGGPRGRSRS
jgi:DNA-binding transcriptional regulator YiaG